jgi:hypothetical protein
VLTSDGLRAQVNKGHSSAKLYFCNVCVTGKIVAESFVTTISLERVTEERAG